MVQKGAAIRNFISSLSLSHWIVLCIIMAMIPIVLILVYFLVADHCEAAYQDKIKDECGDVIYVNVMFRHGNRTTDSTVPNDPYSDLKYWPGGFGAITADGILEHYRLGKWLARRYRHLLPEKWYDINSALKIVSTEWNRTIMSAQSEMAGMFPITENRGNWGGLTSYPVPIHTIPPQSDALLEVTKKCKSYEALVQESIASEEYQMLMNEYENMSIYIEKHSGYHIKTLEDYQILYTIYYIEEAKGLKLPDWLSEVYPFPMIEPAIISFVTPTWDDDLKRFRGGPFVKEVLNNFLGKLNGSNTLNISMYSAHDTSLAAAMNTMNVFNDKIPPFAALFITELRQPENSSEPVVTMWYKNSTMEPFLLEMQKCGKCCPLKEMEQQLKPVIPDDWEKECEGILSDNHI